MASLSAQQTLVAGMLRPAHLLDLLRNFTLFQQSGGRIVKVVARYQQFRAVHKAIHRLQHGQTKAQHGVQDQRGGIVWHTQGSGKSLTMVFLVRRLRTLLELRRFKVVIVTDRTDLERQLSATATLTGERVRRARNTAQLKAILREDGPDLVFAMIQKYHDRDEDAEVFTYPSAAPVPTKLAAEAGIPYDASTATPSLTVADEALAQRLADLGVGVVLHRQPAGRGDLGAGDPDRQAGDNRI